MSSSEKEQLNNYLNQNQTKSFYKLVFDYIDRYFDERGEVCKDSIVYNRAGIDRRLFSKFKGDINESYYFSRNNIIKLCLALELNLDDTSTLLESAGYTLSTTKEFDLIIRYYITHGIYNIGKINQTLYALTKTALDKE